MTHGGLPPAVHELADVEPNILVLIRVWLLRDEAKMPAPDGQDSFLIKVAKPIIAVERRVAMLNLPGLLACDRTVTVPKDRAGGRITPKRACIRRRGRPRLTARIVPRGRLVNLTGPS